MAHECILYSVPWKQRLSFAHYKKKTLETDLEVKAYALWDRLMKKSEENA